MPYLKYSINGEESTFELKTNTISAGRGAEANIRIRDNQTSRLHCQFRKASDGYEVVDLESRNGTIVNGESIKQKILQDGDIVKIGHMTVKYIEGELTAPLTDPDELPEDDDDDVDDVDDDDSGAVEAQAVVQQRRPKPNTSMKAEDDLKLARELRESRDALMVELRKVIIGQEEVIEQVLLALFARGHCLLVGVPGLAKTLLVSSLASILDLRFRRIQFTPDLMPSDITGTRIIEEDADTGRRDFRFVKGPVFANMLLADEINRTPPKTQAALLEAMQEKRVTVAGITYELDLPFLVLATQNPIEQEGTYPLPEAQLDRFMFNIIIDYPTDEDEVDILHATTTDIVPDLAIVISEDRILDYQRIVRKVPVSDYIVRHVQHLVRLTRIEHPDAPDFVKDYVSWGAGPRAGQFIILGAKARALYHGRFNVLAEDIAAVSLPVLRHRIAVNFNARADGVDSDEVVKRLLKECKPPKE